MRNLTPPVLFMLLVFCVISPAARAADYDLQILAEGLAHPWSIAFLPNGDLLVTERAGNLRIIRDEALLPDAVQGVPQAYVRSQGGLFDVLLHPGFATNNLLYLSYAHGGPNANHTRIIRAQLRNDGLTNLEVIFAARPDKDTPVHYGGRMALTKGNHLLITIGDGFDYRESAQRLDNHLGKVIRINLDGSIPFDNPFVNKAGALPEIYSYGHRNAQGLVVTNDGDIYLHEHGPKGGDEINLIEPGRNYGWPIATFGVDYTGARISPFTSYPGTVQPVWQWTPSIAPAGFAWYAGGAFPEWQGDLFVAALVDLDVKRLSHVQGSLVQQESLFSELNARIRDVRVGPDGALYILTDSPQGRVVKVVPGA